MNQLTETFRRCTQSLIVLATLTLVPQALTATETDVTAGGHATATPAIDSGGEVRVPLHAYTALLNQLRRDPRPAPAAYAVGQSRVSVKVAERESTMVATVTVSVTIETFENEWTLVPVLPAGTALSQATVNGKPVQLVQGPDGLSWSTATAGTVTMQLRYGVNATRSDAGFVLPLPVPYAAATHLNGTFPGSGLDLAVIPSANLRSVEKNGSTRLSADLPGTSSVLISWRTLSKQPYVIGRADYQGTLSNDALIWTAQFDVEVFSAEPLSLPLMPAHVTLNDARVDGKRATVFEKDGRFVIGLQGRGMRSVQVTFEVPVIETKGPPQAQVPIPRIPVSAFQLTLPGRKEIKVTPAANVSTRDIGENTLATVFVPMVEQVLFSWSDAVPEDLQTRVRANASLYHALHAEEGVLHGRALAVWEITHGETSQLVLDIPNIAQVNRIVAPSGGISDWAVVASDTEQRKRINVFLDRAVSGEFVLDVYYEQLLGARDASTQAISVPLLSAIDVHRQRGMLALLSGQELALNPKSEERVSRVGENQLPAFVRNQITLTVAHTYKYTDPVPRVTVTAEAPERKQGKFDAQVNTLISLGEVTMKGSATIELDVKSGSIADLFLRLPNDVNVLGVSGPSLRTHHVGDEDDGQTIQMEFTREMEGQFRVEVNYERIMTNVDADLDVPTVTVREAEVEHGRIAIEALTAVEVRAATTEHLSTLDINELPQQLVFKTTNPILLAYRYVHAKPPFKLALKVTRHEEIDVQVAAIETAEYTTLYTRDGLAVTTARFDVRNSRRQFLRLELPPRSQVWSAFVDGKAEKPAHASGVDTSAVLIRMINSTAGFPVEIVYTTPVESMTELGVVGGQLPRPDMVVTHTRWDVFLPSWHRYFAPDSTMDVSVRGRTVNPRQAGAAALRAEDMRKVAMGQPLHISVPTQGVHFAFEKLYANQSPQAALFEVRYASQSVNQVALAASLLGALVFWAGIALLLRGQISRRGAGVVLALGAITVSGAVGYLGTSILPASAVSAALAVALLLYWALQSIRRSRGRNLPVASSGE